MAKATTRVLLQKILKNFGDSYFGAGIEKEIAWAFHFDLYLRKG